MSEQVAEQVDQSAAPLETPAEAATGGSGNDFLTSLPDEIREHPSLAPIKDVENLARSYVNAQRLIGADKVPMPVNPTDEDLDNIYGRLGRPETPQGYEIKPDGQVVTEEVAEQYADIAHRLRLSTEQAEGILEYYKSTIQQSSEAMQADVSAQVEQAETELRQEWGKAFDQKILDAKGIFRDFASEDMLEMQLADGTLVGNHPEFIRAFAKIAEFRNSATSEDTITEATTNRALTPQQAQTEIDSIMNDKSHAYWDRKNPVGRQAAIDRMQQLMEMLHG